jgi:4-amino-4-deoxy-L-arabinose transferase-like glycosyltransferase
MEIKSQISNSKFQTFLILFTILIIASFLRLYNIIEVPPGLYPDEAMNGNNALEALSTGGFKVFYPENNGREGLFMNIQAFFLKFLLPLSGGNPEPWMLRVVSSIFGIITVLGIYFLTKELFNKKIALLSSFFLAVSFWHINFSRIGFRAIMSTLFAVLAVYFLLTALRSRKYFFYSLFGGISLGLGLYSYIAFRALPLLLFLIWLIYWFKEPLIRKKILLSALIFTFTAIAVFAPLGIHFIKNPQDFFGRTTQVSIFSSQTMIKDLGLNVVKTAGMFNFSGDWNWRHNYAGRPELFWPVGIMFIIGIALGLAKIFKNQDIETSDVPKMKFSFIILFSWLIIAALPVVVSNEGIPHALRSILLIPPAIILTAAGGIWIYQSIKDTITRDSVLKDKIFKIFVFLFLSLLVFEAYYTYFISWANNTNTLDAFSNDYAVMATGLNELPKELPKYVVVEANGVDVRGIPMPAQTIMYITDTFTPEKQKEKNIFYVLPNQINEIPKGSYTVILK